jgi:hypothetical protein
MIARLARGDRGGVCVAIVLQIVIAVRVSGTPHEVTAGVLRGSSLAVTTHGYGRVIVNALLVTVVPGLVAALLAAGDRCLPPAWAAELRRLAPR